MNSPDIKGVVKAKYGQAACASRLAEVLAAEQLPAAVAVIRLRRIYTTRRKQSQIPEQAMLASLGCGNPTALAKLNPGETVLDLGSGGGIDVLLVGKTSRPDRQSLRAGHDG